MSMYSNSIVSNIVNKPWVRKLATGMSDHSAMLPVIALEASTTLGRTYQAYKRGGITEARERMVDESITAVIWFGVIKGLNWVFNKMFKSGGLSEIEIDMGKDAIRNPIKYAIQKNPKIKNIIGGFKFSKIALASLIGIYASGVLLPKFYQNMTKKILKKEKTEKKYKEIEKNTKVSMNDFLNKTSKKQLTFGALSLNGILCNSADLLEKNSIMNLLTIDGGLFTGRAINARNKDEMVEFLFRDCSSSFFYLGSTPLIYKLLSRYLDTFKGTNTNLDPRTVEFVTDFIKNKLPENGIGTDDFLKTYFGGNEKLANEIITKLEPKSELTILGKFAKHIKNIFFNNDITIKVDDFKNMINELVSDKNKATEIIQNAQAFIENMRPEGTSKDLLTMSECINSVKGGFLNDAKFLKDAVEKATKRKFWNDIELGDSVNPERFVKTTEIDSIKQNIRDYAESIIQFAKRQGKEKITKNILQQAKNRNMIVRILYTVAGLGVSATFLSTIIPKLQYKITEMRTGKKDFPGIRDIK